MDLYGIGFSNIRLPNDSSSYMYTYDPYINTFPEEVFIHEYLHSLERILQERGYDIPELHDSSKYGYENKKLIGLKEWYRDYMLCKIRANDGSDVGLNEIVYTLTPPAESDFRYSLEVEFNNEPGNIIEEIRIMGNMVLRMFGI